MLLLRSSLISFRASSWLFLLVLIYFLLVSSISVEAQAPNKKNLTAKEKSGITLFESLKKNPWADITGFRSAKFGADEKSVYRAIAKDFKLAKGKVIKDKDLRQGITFLEIIVPELFLIGGTGNVQYIFGHKSKKLIEVSVMWGKGAAKKLDGKSVFYMANLLRTHFLKKRYKEDGLAANDRLTESQTIIFRGRDKKARMILVILTAHPKKEGQTSEQASNNTSLVLSYIANPDKPDYRNISVKDDKL